MNWDGIYERVAPHEGGYVNHPDDPGPETNFGITWPTLREGIRLNLVPPNTTIAGITREQAKLLYKELFWNRIKGDKLPDGVAFQLLDFAIHSGIETATRKLQRAVGAADDGHWGPVSQAALDSKSETDLIMLFLAERIEFMTSLSIWPTFGKGWARRIAKNLRYGAEDS